MVTRNVVCMKWGTVYGPEYVNILHHMVQRNLTGPYRFICLTDNPAGLEEGIETFSIRLLENRDRNTTSAIPGASCCFLTSPCLTLPARCFFSTWMW